MSNLLFKLATLAADPTPGTTNWSWVWDIVNFLKSLLPYLLVVVAAAGSIYAVVLGIKMARAEDPAAREEAKKRIINFIIAFAVTAILILLLNLFVANFESITGIKPAEQAVIGLLNIFVFRFLIK